MEIILKRVLLFIMTFLLGRINYNLNGECIAEYEMGTSEVNYRVPISVYLANSHNHLVGYSNEHIKEIVDGVNRIWSVSSNINFFIEGDIQVFDENTLGDDDVLVGKRSHNYDIDSETLGKKIIPIDNYGKINVIFIDRFECDSFYRCLEGKKVDNSSLFPNLVVVSKRGIWLGRLVMRDITNVSWNLAHELGHILNNLDLDESSIEPNLMTTNSGIKTKCYPSSLTQLQVNISIETAKRFLTA